MPEQGSEQQNAIQVKMGTKLITENEMSRKMYVIIKGKARVYKTYLGQRITLAVLGDGEIFGEMSFFDAQPRSASVEALTDMELIVIDGARGSDQIKNLPPWIWTIFRTVFYRFRELDREIVALQSAVSYRKKGLKEDIVASTIYLELRRFLKTIQLVHQNRVQEGKSLDAAACFEEIDGVLGNKAIGLKTFWKLLQEFDFLNYQELTEKNLIKLESKRIKGFEEYLQSEIGKESYLMLSHGALSVIRQMVSMLENNVGLLQRDENVEITGDKLKVQHMPNHEEALQELETLQILPFKNGVFEVNPDRLHEIYIYHSIIKSFDHSAIYVD